MWIFVREEFYGTDLMHPPTLFGFRSMGEYIFKKCAVMQKISFFKFIPLEI